jgi:hypothetical protein
MMTKNETKYLRKGLRCFPVAKDSTSELVRLSSDRSRPHSSDHPTSQTVTSNCISQQKIFPGAKEKDEILYKKSFLAPRKRILKVLTFVRGYTYKKCLKLRVSALQCNNLYV